MTENDFKSMKEIEVIRLIKNPETSKKVFNDACAFLIKKYEKTIHKAWWTFSKQMRESSLAESKKEEFYSRAYETIYTTILKVDLSRVYDDNFKLIQLVSLYLSNLRHTMINELLKESRSISLETAYKDNDGEESTCTNSAIEYEYYEREGYKADPQYIIETRENILIQNKAIKECLSKWSDLEKAVYKNIISKKTKKEISTEVGISLNELTRVTKKIKNDLRITLLEFGYTPSQN